MHEDHACVFCRHPWQFSLTDSMSKHVSAYMSGDVETTFVYAAVMMQFFIHASFRKSYTFEAEESTPFIVRIFSGSFLRNWMESNGTFYTDRCFIQRAIYHLYDHFVAVSVRPDCSFSDFLPPSLFDCYGDSVHRYLLHGKWKWKPTFGLELEDRVLRKPLILR